MLGKQKSYFIFGVLLLLTFILVVVFIQKDSIRVYGKLPLILSDPWDVNDYNSYCDPLIENDIFEVLLSYKTDGTLVSNLLLTPPITQKSGKAVVFKLKRDNPFPKKLIVSDPSRMIKAQDVVTSLQQGFGANTNVDFKVLNDFEFMMTMKTSGVHWLHQLTNLNFAILPKEFNQPELRADFFSKSEIQFPNIKFYPIQKFELEELGNSDIVILDEDNQKAIMSGSSLKPVLKEKGFEIRKIPNRNQGFLVLNSKSSKVKKSFHEIKSRLWQGLQIERVFKAIETSSFGRPRSFYLQDIPSSFNTAKRSKFSLVLGIENGSLVPPFFEALQVELKHEGIDLSIQHFPLNVLIQKIDQGDVDLYSTIWTPKSLDPIEWAQFLLGNQKLTSSEEDILGSIRNRVSLDVSKEQLENLERLLIKKSALIPVAELYDLYLMGSKVSSLKFSPCGEPLWQTIIK